MSAHIRNRDVLHCLPLLASVLGDQYGVEVCIGGNKAATNGKMIQIPSLPMETDETMLALVRGYIDHESGHIRYTDYDAIYKAQMDAVTKHIWNSIEDWRIENKLAELYPGCRHNLHWLMRHIFLEKRNQELEMAEKQFPAISILNYVLYTVRGWDEPEIDKLKMEERKKLDQYFPSIAVQLDNILNKVKQHCADTKTAIAYALEISKCIKQWMSQNYDDNIAQQSDNETNRRNNDSEELQDNEYKNDDVLESGNETLCPSNDKTSHASTSVVVMKSVTNKEQKEKIDKIDSQTQEQIDSEQRDSLSIVQNAMQDLFQLDESELPFSLGDVLAGELEARAESDAKSQLVVARAVVAQRDSLTEEDKNKAIRACTALRTRLQGLLQAKTLRDCQMGRRGKLHASSLYRFSVGNPKVFQRESEGQGLDTAVHILLDGSGSMSGEPMHLASLSCYSVAKSLEMIHGISVGATVFPADSTSVNVCPLVKHGDRVTDKFGIVATGETPMAEALWWIMQEMLRLREERKILIILTDGKPQRIDAVRHALSLCSKFGLEVYGIGINNSSISRLVPDGSRVITSMDDLAPAMFGILQKALLGGTNGRRNK